MKYEVYVGSRDKLQLTIKDENNNVVDLSNLTTFGSGKWVVIKTDHTRIIDGAIAFEDRANGVVSYTLSATDAVVANVGNWEGWVELFDTGSLMSLHTNPPFSFVIHKD